MAAKSRKKSKSKKREPSAPSTELDFPLMATGTAGAGQAMVKIPEVLSAGNMRLYRQSRNYEVSFTVDPRYGSQTLEYKFYTLPTNWFTMGAIRHAFKNWRYSVQDELQNAVVADWYDFRINTDNLDGDQTGLQAATFDGDSFNLMELGEYNLSKSSIDDGTDKGFHLFGSVADSYNIFQEYARHVDARHPADDSVGGETSTYNSLHDADSTVLAHFQNSGDAPPYPRDLDASNWKDATLILRDTLITRPVAGIGRLKTRIMDAPLGLVFVTLQSDGSGLDFSTTESNMTMHVKSGSYKGVSSQPIINYPSDLRLATARSNR